MTFLALLSVPPSHLSCKTGPFLEGSQNHVERTHYIPSFLLFSSILNSKNQAQFLREFILVVVGGGGQCFRHTISVHRGGFLLFV